MTDAPLKHIFVSHAGADRNIADKLAADLRDAGHETKVDTHELKLGDDSIAFMNEAIADAHTVIILYSKHTANALWQKLEINAAVWNEVAQDGGTCIVVRLDDSDMPPLLGPKLYGKLPAADGEPYRELIEGLCKVILPSQSASSTVAVAFGSSALNPFRRVRAEFFEDSPNLLAKTFAPPDASKTSALEDMKPCLLEGSRGTGKSMLLLSLRGRNYLSGAGANSNPLSIFGVYLKLTRGALCNAGLPTSASADSSFGSQTDDYPVVDISAQEIYISVLESLVSELEYCIERGLLPSDRNTGRRLTNSLEKVLFPESPTKCTQLSDIRDELGDAHRIIADFIRRRFIYGELPQVPFTMFDIDCLRRALRAIRGELASLSNTLFAVLLDEYENLFPFQQRIVNSIVKLAAPDFTVKIAKKLGTSDTSTTVMEQELQEIHDYTRIPLIYDVEDTHQSAAYLRLLDVFVRNTLSSAQLSEASLSVLLPVRADDEVRDEDRCAEVARLCKVTPEEFGSWEPKKQREKLVYYGEAAVYRCLHGGKGGRREKHFSGKDDLAFLSSGVIRYFQEFLGVAFHLAFSSGVAAETPLEIDPEFQSQAVHIVSRHNLATLSRNVESHGEVLKYLLLDIGKGLRYKLLRHGSEPEAARLTLADPERLRLHEMEELNRILTVAIREGVFQSKDGLPAFRPKHSYDPQPVEFNICRLFAPVLQISPRLRWRTSITCANLRRLVEPNTRAEASKGLNRLWGPPQAAQTDPPLFKN